jgi:hypothetical protein
MSLMSRVEGLYDVDSTTRSWPITYLRTSKIRRSLVDVAGAGMSVGLMRGRGVGVPRRKGIEL